MPAPAQPGNGHHNGTSDVTTNPDNIAQKSLHVQEAIAGLQREFIMEALRISSTKAWHAADDLALGDDASAARGIRIAILNLREAATAFRQLEALTSAINAVQQREASAVMGRASP